MGFKCGIVGLPNVGKSTLFNALMKAAQAEAANYPFCTIEPNSGRVPVPDPRLNRIAALSKSARVVPTYLEVVDIAGLVRGASKGEGLGNQFLGHIREVDAIIEVLRCFDGTDVTHVEGSVDPIRDAETIETELMLADMDSLERRLAPLAKRAKTGDKDAKATAALMERTLEALQAGRPARTVAVAPAEEPLFRQLFLLTAKPILYICNVGEEEASTGNAHAARVAERAAAEGTAAIVISAAIEADIALLDDEAERQEFLGSLGLAEPGLDRVVRAAYTLLDQITFFTSGPKESRAWTIKRGTQAPQAAGEIHSDFERGFISAETIAYDDFATLGGEQGAREAGRLRLEGRTYVVQDGDIILFRFNV